MAQHPANLQLGVTAPRPWKWQSSVRWTVKVSLLRGSEEWGTGCPGPGPSGDSAAGSGDWGTEVQAHVQSRELGSRDSGWQALICVDKQAATRAAPQSHTDSGGRRLPHARMTRTGVNRARGSRLREPAMARLEPEAPGCGTRGIPGLSSPSLTQLRKAGGLGRQRSRPDSPGNGNRPPSHKNRIHEDGQQAASCRG